MAAPKYLMWFDDNPKVSPLRKIEEAIQAYTQRYQKTPNVVLVSEQDNGILTDGAERVEHNGVEIRGSSMVRRNIFWVGRETRQLAPVS
jgi:hypothetical protein